MRGPERRERAKVPESVEFQTKPALAGELVARASGWRVRRAPVLGDQAYGGDSKLRGRLDDDAIDYVLSVGPETEVFDLDTVFAVPPRKPGSRGPAPSVERPDREPQPVASALAPTPSRPSRFATTTAGDSCRASRSCA